MRTDYGHAEESALGRPTDLRLLGRLWPYLRPQLRLLGVAVGLVLLITVFEVALPYVTKEAVDRYIVPVGAAPDTAARLAGITRLTALFLLLAAGNFAANFFQVQLLERVGQRVMHLLRMHLMRHLMALPVPFFDRQPVGRLVTRVTNDTQNMHELFTSVVAFVFKDLFLMVGIAAVLLGLDARLALISFAVLPPVFVAAWLFASRSREVFRRLRLRLAEINTRFAETIGGLSVIQLLGRESANSRQFAVLNQAYYRLGMRQIHIFAVFLPVIELLNAAALAVVIYFGGGAALSDRISLGALVAYISYMRMFFRPIRDLAEKYNIMQNAMASAERIFGLLDETDRDGAAATAACTAPAPRDEDAAIAFDNVAFGYESDQPVLRNVTLRVARGETLAVVGPTGAGKTSLIHLLLRFYPPDQGCIRLAGADIVRLPLDDLRRRIALVSQDPFLFSAPLHANIFFDQRPEPAAQRALLAAAQCEDLIRQLPEGLDTHLGEAGRALSSGQRQLVAIARALARNPEIIIFDEATAHVDSATEERIQTALAHLTRQRTAIIVAHRLATARTADRIAVLQHGRIVEQGSHEALIRRRGVYHRLWQQQHNGE